MQPTPPKSKKPGYRRPFYDAGKKTSAEIVSEARTTMKVLETSRPYTPIETSRRLFGSAARTSSEGRPPSAFSIGPSTFTDPMVRSSSRPPTGKLSPLKQASFEILPKTNRAESPSISKTTRRSSDSSAMKYSLPSKSENGPILSKQQNASHQQNVTERRTQSGPKEHTTQRQSEVSKHLRKSNSFGTIARDIISADSGVGRDLPSAGSIEHFSELLCSSNDVLSQDKESPVSSIASNNSNRHSSAESSMRLSQSRPTDEDDTTNDTDPDNGSNNSVVDSHSICFKETIEPLLRQMELNHLHSDVEALETNFDVLLKNLEISGLLVKATGSGTARQRSLVLRTLFKFVDVDSPEVILKLCKIALMMRVTGKNMVNICKLVFKISRDKSKDFLFKETKIISDVLKIVQMGDINTLYEGVIYATGAIKFLALNDHLHDDLMQADCTSCFADLLTNIKSQTYEVPVSHLIVQASAAIRNLADIPNARASFIRSGLVQALGQLVLPFWKDADFILNVSRILSKLTQYSDCCNVIGKDGAVLGPLLQAMRFHHKNQDITVRLAFVLGNVAAKEVASRRDLYFKHKSLDILLAILKENLQTIPTIVADKNPNTEKEIERSSDILIKVVRIIANMAIDENVASDITSNMEFIDIVIHLLQNQGKGEEIEELFINTAAMLNNLSFYASDESVFTSKTKQLTEALLHLLFIDNMDCITEVTRVLGNFTRFNEIRTLLREKKVVQMLITLLESSEREVVFCACGALINLMVDSQNREILSAEKGAQKLLDALKDFGQTDWQLSSMICQTLWNYSEKITSSVSCFGKEETEELIQTLQDYTDPETAFDYSENPEIDLETIDLMKQIWKEQFQHVGNKLLHRIESYHTELEPLVETPD